MFWTSVRDEIVANQRWDQETVNRLLNLSFPIKWTTFPSSVWNYTQRDVLPKNMILHHANAAKTQQEKMDQFERVRVRWRKTHYPAIETHNYSGVLSTS